MLSIRQSIVKLFLLAASVGAHRTMMDEMPHKDHQQEEQDQALLDGRELENEWPRKNIARYGRKFDRVIKKVWCFFPQQVSLIIMFPPILWLS